MANLAVAVTLLLQVRAAGILVSMMGNWPPPFGIALVADLLSTIMVVLSATMGLTVLMYSFGDINRRREQWGYYPLFHLLLMGINGSFLTGDLFNLFVFFEVMLIASNVLLSLAGEPGHLMWAALQGKINAANLVIGFLVSAALIYLFRRMFFRPLYFRKGVLGLTLALVFIKELIKSNIAVLRVVLNPWLRVRSGVVAVPTELTNDVALTVLANMITLTPGTLTLDISPDRRYLYVHTLNLDDVEEVKQEIRQAFEVYLRELSR